jgi:hypothetical protein
VENDKQPILQINQNLIVALAIGASILAIVLYYENKRMREQFMPQRRPCNCQEQQQVFSQPNQNPRAAVYDQMTYEHNPDPSVMPNNQKPPEVVVD